MKKRIVAFVCALLLLGSLSAGAVEGEAARAADILTTLNSWIPSQIKIWTPPPPRAQAARAAGRTGRCPVCRRA